MKLCKEVVEEMTNAINKFPTWPSDPLHALAVVGEEFGELSKEVLQFTYEPEKSDLDSIKKEAVQTVVVALRFLHSLDSYTYARSTQHSQGDII